MDTKTNAYYKTVGRFIHEGHVLLYLYT
uniref:Uncharacterized protein n=1 Tax=Anguilla anguilla TaxID=7936 RepID=A0A0E9UND8_ANGAN